jgi:hypothetical protein
MVLTTLKFSCWSGLMVSNCTHLQAVSMPYNAATVSRTPHHQATCCTMSSVPTCRVCDCLHASTAQPTYACSNHTDSEAMRATCVKLRDV